MDNRKIGYNETKHRARRSTNEEDIGPWITRVLLILLGQVHLLTVSLAQGSPNIKWIRGGHLYDVNIVTFSPDGRYLASGGSDNTIKIWQISDGKLFRTIVHRAPLIHSIAFSPCGSYLASAGGSSDSANHAIKLWRVSDGALVRTIANFSGAITSIAFSPDGNYLASGHFGGLIHLWHIEDGTLVLTLEASLSHIYFVAYSPDGRYLASADADGTVKIWQMPNGQLAHAFFHGSEVYSIAFSRSGTYLASGGLNGIIMLWNVPERSLLRTLCGHSMKVCSVAFSPDDEYLASGGGYYSQSETVGEIKLWRISDGSLVYTIIGPSSNGRTNLINSIAFSVNGYYLASGSANGAVILWRSQDGIFERELSKGGDFVHSVAFSPDGQYIATPGNGLIRYNDSLRLRSGVVLYRVSDGTVAHVLIGNTESSSYAIAFSTNGRYLASGNSDGTISLWNIPGFDLLHTFQAHSSHIHTIAFSPDNQYLASGSSTGFPDYQGEIKLWNLQYRSLLMTFSDHSALVTSLAFSPDGQYLASGSLDGSILIRRIPSGELIKNIVHGDCVYSIAFSPNGNYLASAGKDGKVRLWRISDGELLQEFLGYDYPGYVSSASVSFTSDGQYIVSSMNNHIFVNFHYFPTVRFWRISDGTLYRFYNQEIGFAVLSIQCSPTEPLFAFGRADATLVLARIPLVGDINDDGCVDDVDLLAILFAFGNSGSDLPEDVNKDGIVNDGDLLIVIFNFGGEC